MVGISRDDDGFSAGAHADDSLLNEALLAESKGAVRPLRNNRRSIEELLEQKRLRKQLEEVFGDDFDN